MTYGKGLDTLIGVQINSQGILFVGLFHYRSILDYLH